MEFWIVRRNGQARYARRAVLTPNLLGTSRMRCAWTSRRSYSDGNDADISPPYNSRVGDRLRAVSTGSLFQTADDTARPPNNSGTAEHGKGRPADKE